MFAPQTRILIVDGMVTMRKLVVKACKEIGFTDITEAADGVLAWEQIDSADPQFGLIISDWSMPNCSGLDLLKRVRGHSRHGKTPFILVTAEAEEHHIIEAARAGVSSYLVRPFTTESLQEKIEQVHKKLAA